MLEQKKSNPLRSYLGLSDEEQKRIQRRDALIDRDLYSDLRRCVCGCGCECMDGWAEAHVCICVCFHHTKTIRTRTPMTHTTPDRYGFDYLVLPVMEQGGFRVFAEMLSEGRDVPPREEDNGRLALGRYEDMVECVWGIVKGFGYRVFSLEVSFLQFIHFYNYPSSSLHKNADH